MVDALALLLSHGLLVLVMLRLLKVRDPSLPERPQYKRPPLAKDRPRA